MAAAGLELLFDACVVRFEATATLKTVGRILSWVDQSTQPWTEFESIARDTLDGFSDDIELWNIQFTYHGKSPLVRGASTWLEEMTGAFDDFTGLDVSGYTVSGVNRIAGDDGPFRQEGSKIFDAAATYEFILHRDVLLPLVRGA